MSLGVMGSSAGAGAGPVVGTYSGTGSAKTLTFDAPVKSMIVTGDFYGTSTAKGIHTAVLNDGKYTGQQWGANSSATLAPVTGTYTTSGNTVTLPVEFSRSSKTYYYIAFF